MTLDKVDVALVNRFTMRQPYILARALGRQTAFETTTDLTGSDAVAVADGAARTMAHVMRDEFVVHDVLQCDNDTPTHPGEAALRRRVISKEGSKGRAEIEFFIPARLSLRAGVRLSSGGVDQSRRVTLRKNLEYLESGFRALLG